MDSCLLHSRWLHDRQSEGRVDFDFPMSDAMPHMPNHQPSLVSVMQHCHQHVHILQQQVLGKVSRLSVLRSIRSYLQALQLYVQDMLLRQP
jgi:hypothetical protein